MITINSFYYKFRDFRERMRAFAQFYTAQEYEKFLENLERERALRLRISELYRYRENGVTRHEECSHLEQLIVQTQNHVDGNDRWSDKKSVSVTQLLQLMLYFNYILVRIEIGENISYFI